MRRLPYLHLILFLLTFVSTVFVGAYHQGVDMITDPQLVIREPWLLLKGIPFSLTLLLILGVHEASHYISSMRHGVDATLPYFIPMPNLFGTLGAFIKMKSPIKTRNALMDIGASGPIAGFVVSLVVVIIGLFLSKATPMSGTQDGQFVFGPSLLFYGLTVLILGPIPKNYGIDLHSMAFAGWIGFFVTALNLIPVGQLDGGHIAYALLGKKQETISKFLVGVLVALGVAVFYGWLIWAVLLLVLGLRHPPIIYDEIPLDRKRKLIGWAALVIFVLTFVPVPVIVM